MGSEDPGRRSEKGRPPYNKPREPKLGLGRDTLSIGSNHNPSRRPVKSSPVQPAQTSSFYNPTPSTRPVYSSRSGPIELDSDNGEIPTPSTSSKATGKHRVDDNDGQILTKRSRQSHNTHDYVDYDAIPNKSKSATGVAANMSGKGLEKKSSKSTRKSHFKASQASRKKGVEIDDGGDNNNDLYTTKVMNETLREGYLHPINLNSSNSNSVLYLAQTKINDYDVEKCTRSSYALHFDDATLSLCKRVPSQKLIPWRVIDLQDLYTVQTHGREACRVFFFVLKDESPTVRSFRDPKSELALGHRVDEKELALPTHLNSAYNTISLVTDPNSMINSKDKYNKLVEKIERAMSEGIGEMTAQQFEKFMRSINGGNKTSADTNRKKTRRSNVNETILIDEDDNDNVDDDDDSTPKAGKQKRKNTTKGQSDDIESFSEDEREQAKKRPRALAGAKQATPTNSKDRPPPKAIVPGQARAQSQSTIKNQDDDDYGSQKSLKSMPVPRTKATRKAKSDAVKANNEVKASTSSTSRKSPMDPAIANEIYLIKEFDNGSLTIRRGDRASIDPGEFLNDCIVEYGIRSTLMRLRSRDPILADQVHLFSSFFYTSLVNSYEGLGDPYKTMWRWTKSVDIFAKKFILVPICENLHWYLAIIYNPKGVLYGPPGEIKDKKKPKPRPSAGAAGAAANAAAVKRQEGLKKKEAAKYERKVEAAKKKKTHDIVELSSDSEDEQKKDEKDGSKASSSATGGNSPEVDKDDDVVMTDVPPSTQAEQNEASSQSNIPDSSAVEVVGSAEGESGKVEGDVDVVHENRNQNARCYIYTLDSLSGTHKVVIDNLSRYLQMEAKGRKDLPPEAFSHPDGKTPKVPKQPNWCDCGVYVIHYIDVFFKDTSRYLDLLYNSYRIRRDQTDPQWENKAAISARERLTKELDEGAAKFDAEEIRKGRRQPNLIADNFAKQNDEKDTTATATGGDSDKAAKIDGREKLSESNGNEAMTAVTISTEKSDDSKTRDEAARINSIYPKVEPPADRQSISQAKEEDKIEDSDGNGESTVVPGNINTGQLDTNVAQSQARLINIRELEAAMASSLMNSEYNTMKEQNEQPRKFVGKGSDRSHDRQEQKSNPHRAWESTNHRQTKSPYPSQQIESVPPRQSQGDAGRLQQFHKSWALAQRPQAVPTSPALPASQSVSDDELLLQKLTAEDKRRQSLGDDHLFSKTLQSLESPAESQSIEPVIQANPAGREDVKIVTNSSEDDVANLPSSSVKSDSTRLTPKSSPRGNTSGSSAVSTESQQKRKRSRKASDEMSTRNSNIRDYFPKSAERERRSMFQPMGPYRHQIRKNSDSSDHDGNDDFANKQHSRQPGDPLPTYAASANRVQEEYPQFQRSSKDEREDRVNQFEGLSPVGMSRSWSKSSSDPQSQPQLSPPVRSGESTPINTAASELTSPSRRTKNGIRTGKTVINGHLTRNKR